MIKFAFSLAFHLEELEAVPPSLRNALHHHRRGEVLVIFRRSETHKPVKKEFWHWLALYRYLMEL